MSEIADLVFRSYGLFGILCVAPIASTIYLWRYVDRTTSSHINQIVSLHEMYFKQISEVNKLRVDDVNRVTATLLDVQEKRVSDAKAVVTTLIQTVTEQTQMNTEVNLALERVGDILSGHGKAPSLSRGHLGEGK